MRKLLLALALLVLGAIQPSFAEITYKNYQDRKNTDAFALYIKGVGNGFGWANVSLHLRKQPLLFCTPEKLHLSTQNYLDILEAELKTEPKPLNPDTPLEFILLLGLQDTFPCKK